MVPGIFTINFLKSFSQILEVYFHEVYSFYLIWVIFYLSELFPPPWYTIAWPYTSIHTQSYTLGSVYRKTHASANQMAARWLATASEMGLKCL